MNVSNELPEFDSDDRRAWANFLGTRAGQRLFPRAAAACPTLLTSGETNAIVGRAGEVQGFMTALRELSALTAEDKPANVVDSATYPAPEDDSAWDDKRKAQQTP